MLLYIVYLLNLLSIFFPDMFFPIYNKSTCIGFPFKEELYISVTGDII